MIGDIRMVKECLVVLNNEAVTVVRYDGKDIQFPAINKDVKKVSVNYENGKYSIVNDKVRAVNTDKPKKKNGIVKKTTFEEAVENTEKDTKLEDK